jgi:DNA polymerase III psi subunit
MCEVLDTAVRKAVSRERQKLNTEKNRETAAIVREKERLLAEINQIITKNNLVIADMDRSLKFKNQQIESLKRENELLRKRIASAIVKNS